MSARSLTRACRASAEDPDIEPLGAMAIYRLTLAWPDTDGLLAVLNEKTSLLDAIVIDRKRVGIVAD
ncbi:hypothetical protein NFO65_26240 [Neorhizobium galegae]|uniref:hypothetical protein n=1 Tax=Neorhizobium galegae TaxID=399 RepID=UPI0021019288|nr:hypothetical protein [Neorhizobium galegae]MCQ1574230.1 hypothetical protein [Neorhizobium galegae]MCQ1837610.1 hypothetical protein [Neorhizobium galegae]